MRSYNAGAEGYESKYINFVSAGANPPLQDFSADMNVIKDAFEELLVGGSARLHSYGGLPGSEAMKNYMDNNTGANDRGRILRLAWICGFVAPKSITLFMGVDGADDLWRRGWIPATVCF